MASIRAAFVEKFGEQQAKKIEQAAEFHDNEVHSNRGADPFKWVLLIAIGYECISRDKFRDYHKITVPHGELRDWIVAHADLGTHDGDCDYIGLLGGAYSEYMPKKEEATA